ncbi:hypothetical protein BMI87_07095 [Thioclava sp. F28-4]|nr:hypothetical protein BMI87_07095 [Thioclava sp. F28-4]
MAARRGRWTLAGAAFTNKVIPVFYDGYEMRAWEMPLGRQLSQLRGVARRSYRKLKRKQPYTGFFTAFLNLTESLRRNGYDVRINDFALARRSPDRPIAIAGHQSVWSDVDLPNPTLFGPGWVPYPDRAEAMLAERNYQIVTQPSEWPIRLYTPQVAAKMAPMFVGIDTDRWPLLAENRKQIDCVIYNKIRWNHAAREADTMQPLRAMLERRGLSSVELKYGEHELAEYRSALAKGRALIFVTEHETQGLAYQEAMSSGVPVFAWDEGELVDPLGAKFVPEGLEVSAVPYFDDRCGLRWTRANMEGRFEDFWARLPEYQPREYILDELSLERGARRFLDLFERIA